MNTFTSKSACCIVILLSICGPSAAQELVVERDDVATTLRLAGAAAFHTTSADVLDARLVEVPGFAVLTPLPLRG